MPNKLLQSLLTVAVVAIAAALPLVSSFSGASVHVTGFTSRVRHVSARLTDATTLHRRNGRASLSSSSLFMFGEAKDKPTEKEASAAIDKVVKALRSDKTAKEELGNIQGVNNVLGYGAPKAGILAVRFNASFKKGGIGKSSIPMPFGLGQTNKSEGRGTMVGQVKASVDRKTGKVLDASVFRDLGYGRSFNLKC